MITIFNQNEFKNLLSIISNSNDLEELIKHYELVINNNDYDDSFYIELLNDFIIELDLRAKSIKGLDEFKELWNNDPTNIYLMKKNLIRLITNINKEYNYNNIFDNKEGQNNAKNRYGKQRIL